MLAVLALVGRMPWTHFQIKRWMTGEVFSFQISPHGEFWVSLAYLSEICLSYRDLTVKFHFSVRLHKILSWSSLLWWVMWMVFWTSLENQLVIRLGIHSPLSFSNLLTLLRSVWQLGGLVRIASCPKNHLSFQMWILEPSPIFQW